MIGKIILLAFVILALGASSYLIYTIYQDYYSPARNFNINYTQLESQPSYAGNLQYYPNMRFNHNDISYSIDSSCPSERLNNIKEALSILQARVNIISFSETGDNPDITISCSDKDIEQEKNTFIAGSGGAEGSIPFSGVFYIIPKGDVTLYKEINCNYPIVEIHEILHVFGFNHSENKESIMYPVASCNQALTNDIVSELKRLYSIEALPDLYFSDLSASRKGSYIALNFSVKNKGLKDSGNSTIILYADNKEKEKFDLDNIEPGAGIGRTIQNLRISANSLKLIINNSREMDESNNQADLVLS